MASLDRKTAIVGWAVGAAVMVVASVGVIQIAPENNRSTQLAAVPVDLDNIVTGSIGSASRTQMFPRPVEDASALQERVNSLSITVQTLREALAAAQANSLSANRRLQTLEDIVSTLTQTVERPGSLGSDQPLPISLGEEFDGDVTQEQVRVVLPTALPTPAPIPADGGAVAVNIRPLEETSPETTAQTDNAQAFDEQEPIVQASGARDLEVALAEETVAEEQNNDPLSAVIADGDTLAEIAQSGSGQQIDVGPTGSIGLQLSNNVLDDALDEVISSELETTASEIGIDQARQGGVLPTQAVVLSQTPFAVDIGGGPSLQSIDSLWEARLRDFEAPLENLSPRILLQETLDGQLELRLVAGPIEDAADAALLCAQLVAAGLERCFPAIFDGQQLALR